MGPVSTTFKVYLVYSTSSLFCSLSDNYHQEEILQCFSLKQRGGGGGGETGERDGYPQIALLSWPCLSVMVCYPCFASNQILQCVISLVCSICKCNVDNMRVLWEKLQQETFFKGIPAMQKWILMSEFNGFSINLAILCLGIVKLVVEICRQFCVAVVLILLVMVYTYIDWIRFIVYTSGGEALVYCNMMESLLKVIKWHGEDENHTTVSILKRYPNNFYRWSFLPDAFWIHCF